MLECLPIVLEKALFAIDGTGRSFRVTKHDDLSTLWKQFRETLCGQHATPAVVGRDEADVLAPLQPGIDDDDRNLRARGIADRADERRLVERREHDPRHAARDEALDLGHLRCPIVFAKRAPPDDVDAKLASGLRSARVNALPEYVRCALGDDGDRCLGVVAWRGRAARAEQYRKRAPASSIDLVILVLQPAVARSERHFHP